MMNLPLSKLEIILATGMLVCLIGVVYLAFIVPAICPAMLKDTIQQCNFLHEKELVNKCYQSYYSPSSWNVLEHMNSTLVNQTLKDNNLTIETGQDRLNRRLNVSGG